MRLLLVRWKLTPGSFIATFLGHVDVVVCVDIGECRSITASCSDDTTACMRRPKDHTLSRPIASQRDSMAACSMLSPDGSQAVTGDAVGVVRGWDAKTNVLLSAGSSCTRYRRNDPCGRVREVVIVPGVAELS
jgi:WD40 repeat protein